MPLNFHANARPAALASIAAQRQGKFWEYHDRLFENQSRIGGEDLRTWARIEGLDMEQFERDLQDPATRRQLQVDIQDAVRAGVRGTPTVFLNGRRVLTRPQSAQAIVDLVRTEILQSP
jgi:protein-disulfide isomerase